MEASINEKIIRAYADGQTIEGLMEFFKATENEVLNVLHSFRDEQRAKRAFSELFKQVLADRDLSGIPRTTIAKEMGINVNTVKKACEMHGQDAKGKVTSDKSYTKIDGEFPTDKCVECDSKRYNQVYDNTYYCRLCGNEYIHKEDHVLRVNWEYVE